MKKELLPFCSRDFDVFLAQWLNQQISAKDRTEWLKLLTEEPNLREEFCDWIRSLRDPSPKLAKRNKALSS